MLKIYDMLSQPMFQRMGCDGGLYFAHSTADASQADWQSLPDHLKGVGALAKEYADVFGGGLR